VVDLLLAHGANPAHALAGAAEYRQAHLVQSFLKKHPTLCSQPLYSYLRLTEPPYIVSAGIYALENGIINQNPAIITALVEAGVSLNERLSYEYPVALARKYRAEWIVNHLLFLGAENQVDNWYNRPKPEKNVGGVLVSPRTLDWIG
jgi:hypothetical protein